MMNKNALKTYAVWARVQLIELVKQKAFEYGITEDSYGEENARTIGTRALSNAEVNQRAELVSQIKSKGFKQVVEEVAYTWFNRFIALRYMEVDGYLPSRVRVFTNENNEFEPEILKEAISIELDGLDKNIVFDLVEKQDNDALYKYLLITQCNALSPLLPGMFEKISNYTELLFPNNLLRSDSVLGKMISDIPEEDWTDQVQIIGWMYQFYNIEPKAVVFGRKGNVKIKKEEIPAVTQLFTPDWIVRYMVENSLGRLWVEGHENNELKANWKYYLEEAEQEESVKTKLQEIKAEYANIKPEEIKVIDPCMGSGHILVYAFDVLMQIYLSCGYSERDAAQSIVENNLYGLDIDDRAYQLAYFAVMMKARSYDRRFLTRGIKPNVYSIQESNFLQGSWYKISSDAKFKDVFKEVVNSFVDAKEYGSILDVPAKDYDYAMSVIDEFEQNGVIDFETKAFLDNIDVIRSLIGQAKAMSQKYEVVVTNPPYMPVSNAGAKLSDYVKENYPDSKTDLFAVFIERCKQMLRKNGYQAMITMHSWMFLSSYEKLREKMLLNDTVNMAHLGARAFDEIGGEVVQTTAFVLKNSYNTSYKATYCRLVEPNTQNGKEEMFLSEENRYYSVQSNFSKIPGSPIAYWVTDNFFRVFENGELISKNATPKQGMSTCDVNRFIKLWSEIDITKSNLFNTKNHNKWVRYNKGGEYRRWYGNRDYVVLWNKDGNLLKANKAALRNQDSYFDEFIAWTKISSTLTGFRDFESDFLFDGAGGSLFLTNNKEKNYYLGFLNSKPCSAILNIISPTLNFNESHIGSLPLIKNREYFTKVSELAENNIVLSKKDWDSFENSWDFKEHPLVRLSKDLWDVTAVGASMHYYYGCHPKVGSPLELCYMLWQGECNERFNKLKANEEELNRIFIDVYGLQDELTPEVEDKDVTVRKADLTRDIKSLISYAVGCMFGRYSIEAEGLQYAGGNFNEWYNSLSANGYQLTANIVDKDNILPICDDEYFEDDIVGRFVDFIKVVYGAETLEENLRFIADALGGKGTPREVIRNYFINDFYKDHCKIYQKRPIYWMFDSGKKNGFKALVYMHRYQPDTIARMRTDYVHEQQERYRTLSESLSIEYDTATGTDRTKIGKQIDKLKDQLIEIGAFEEKVHHLADQMIDIDLDDGVRVNYAKFGDILGKIK